MMKLAGLTLETNRIQQDPTGSGGLQRRRINE
jgi:hypothetical protein